MKFKLKYLHISVKTAEIEASDVAEAKEQFLGSCNKDENNLYNILAICPLPVDSAQKLKEKTCIINEHSKLIGDIILNMSTQELYRGNKAQNLTENEYETLIYLVSHCDEYCPSEELFRNLYADAPKFNGYSREISYIISRLRRKFRTLGSSINIENTRGSGYKLVI